MLILKSKKINASANELPAWSCEALPAPVREGPGRRVSAPWLRGLNGVWYVHSFPLSLLLSAGAAGVLSMACFVPTKLWVKSKARGGRADATCGPRPLN